MISRLPGLMSRWQVSPCRSACSIPWQNWTPNRSAWAGRAGRADPADQVSTLHQLQNHVRLALDDLHGMGLHDVRVLAKLHPEPALRGEPRPPDPMAEQLVLERLEGHDRPAGLDQMVMSHIDQAHPAFVDVEDSRTGRQSSRQPSGRPP